MDLIDCGVDFFTSVYPNVIAESGFAFSFPLLSSDKIDPDGNVLNLRDNKYQRDWRPLIGNVVIEGESAKINPETESDGSLCPCYCCRRHTRAYLHHLLNTHELLACVLLNM